MTERVAPARLRRLRTRKPSQVSTSPSQSCFSSHSRRPIEEARSAVLLPPRPSVEESLIAERTGRIHMGDGRGNGALVTVADVPWIHAEWFLRVGDPLPL
jgi:hypothetical protein